MDDFQKHLNRKLKDPEFKKAWEEQSPEFELKKVLYSARIDSNLTQMEVSKRTGIPQADISRIENGTANPTIKTVQKFAKGLGLVMHLSFTKEANA